MTVSEIRTMLAEKVPSGRPLTQAEAAAILVQLDRLPKEPEPKSPTEKLTEAARIPSFAPTPQRPGTGR